MRMLNKILVPLDGSELAEGALSFATALSIPTAARLVLVRAVTAHTFPGVDEREAQVRALAEAEIYLRTVGADLARRGFVVETASPYGETPAEWIARETVLRHANLIVMSTHGRTGPSHWIFGSVAESLVAHCPVPVLVQRAWDVTRRELLLGDSPRILVPLDGSPFAACALPVAATLAEDLGGQLVLSSVDTTPHDVRAAEQDVATYMDPEAGPPGVDIESYLSETAAELEPRWPGLTISWIAESGEPADGIARATQATDAALVVMATHGRTGLLRTALGSVAGRVLRHGTAPLVLVRPQSVPAQSAQDGDTATTIPDAAPVPQP